MRTPTTAAAGLAVLLASHAAVACDATIAAIGLSPEASYDPFDPAGVSRELDVQVQNTGAADCVFRLSFQRSPAVDPVLGGALPYELEFPAGGSLLDDRPVSEAPVIYLATGALGDGQSVQLGYRWRIPAGSVQPPGIYGDSVDLRLYEAETTNLVDSRALTPSAIVEETLGINLAGTDVDSPYTHSMSFGALEPGAFREILIEMRSNQAYRLALESDHAGELVLDGGEGIWRIPYQARLDGEDRAIPGSVTGYAPTDIGGRSLPFRITIGEIGGVRAGTYRDVITIRIEPDV